MKAPAPDQEWGLSIPVDKRLIVSGTGFQVPADGLFQAGAEAHLGLEPELPSRSASVQAAARQAVRRGTISQQFALRSMAVFG